MIETISLILAIINHSCKIGFYYWISIARVKPNPIVNYFAQSWWQSRIGKWIALK